MLATLLKNMPVEVALMYDVGVIELSVTLAGWNPIFFGNLSLYFCS